MKFISTKRPWRFVVLGASVLVGAVLIVMAFSHYYLATNMIKAKKALNEEKYAQATSYLKRTISKDPSNIEAKELLASIYERKRNFLRAAKLWEAVAKLDPFNEKAIEKQTSNLYSLGAYKAVLNLSEPIYADGKATAAEKIYLSKSYLALGKVEEASRIADSILKNEPGNPNARLLLGNVLFLRKEIERAKRTYEQIRSESPEIESAKAVGIGNCLYYEGKIKKALKWYLKADKLANGSYQTQLVLADVYKSNDDFDKALKILTTLHKKNPTSIEVIILLADIYFIKGDFLKIRSLVHSIDGKGIIYIKQKYYLNGLLLFSEEEYDDALKNLEWAGEAFQNKWLSLFCRIYINTLERNTQPLIEELNNFFKQNDINKSNLPLLGFLSIEAEKAFKEGNYVFSTGVCGLITQTNPDFQPAHVILMWSYFVQGKTRDAEHQGNIVLRHNDKSISGLEVMGRIALNDGRFERALSYFDKIIRYYPEVPNGYYWAGLTRLREKKLAESTKLLEQALKISPENTQLIDAMYTLCLAKGDYARLSKLAESLLGSRDKDVESSGYFLKGKVEQSLGHLKEAAENYREAIGLTPDNITYYLNLAKTLSKLEKYDAAFTALNNALEVTPRNKYVLFEIGYLHYLMKDYEKSITEFKKLTQLEPDWALPFINLSQILMESRDNGKQEAITCAEKAVKLSPGSTIAQLNLGEIYYAGKEYGKARTQFNEVLKMDPDNETARAYISKSVKNGANLK